MVGPSSSSSGENFDDLGVESRVNLTDDMMGVCELVLLLEIESDGSMIFSVLLVNMFVFRLMLEPFIPFELRRLNTHSSDCSTSVRRRSIPVRMVM